MTCRQVLVQSQAERDNKSRRRERRGDSQPCGSSGSVVLQRTLCQSIQLAGLDVSFELPVPGFRVEPGKPLTECG